MGRTIGIGHQNFATIREKNYFYIDKTAFIEEWWENGDSVTLITRPRRFGKTLAMSMTEQFFSVEYKGRSDLFAGLSIWEKEEYRNLQGTYPVLSLSFADIKETDYTETKKKICQTITGLYNHCDFLLKGDFLNEKEKDFFNKVCAEMEDYVATLSLKTLSEFLYRYYGKRVIILLDEYDTPMQESYVDGYWKELVAFTRSLFNATFKSNPYLEKAIMTGITRVSKESIFSDLNNLEVVTTTADKYADSFGFTEEEVFAALDEFSLSDKKQEVKYWYDGFIFGHHKDIYNPWSIINLLDKKHFMAYWANTSANSLAGKLIREGSKTIKSSFEELLNGKSLTTEIDEQIVYNQLDHDERAIWSLLLASGYLKVKHHRIVTSPFGDWSQEYELELTNFEVKVMFRNMIRSWFGSTESDYNDFLKALLLGDLKAMNGYMNRITLEIFSYFDTGKNPSRTEPERFYHGFVLGLLVDFTGRYVISSNRESGYGRYDVVLEPLFEKDDAIILEFKVHDAAEETTLQETVQKALEQIEEKKYAQTLLTKGIPENRIRKYGFAFEGKKVLIGK